MSSISKKQSTNTKTITRYASYAYPGAAARQANYIVDHAAPAMLYLLRRAESQPYTPLSADTILHAAHPQNYDLRPPPHVSQQATMDFYRAVRGHYGVPEEGARAAEAAAAADTVKDMIVSSRALQKDRSHTNTSASRGVSAIAVPVRPAVHLDASHATVHGSTGTPAVRTAASSEVASHAGDKGSATNSFTQKVDDYRLSQIRQNAQHTDNAQGSRICNYYNTPRGCRRGQSCEFLHVNKGN